MIPSFALFSLLSVLGALEASATPLVARQGSVTPLTADQIAAYLPYTLYARAAYCPASETSSWSCGTNCNALPGFIPYASGGDGDTVQYWYVGYDPVTLNSVVVGHEGTDPSELEADLTDTDFSLSNLNSTLFPGLSSSIEVHSGFADEQALTALDILAAVNDVISATGATQVTIVGHSLGGALAELDAVFLPLHLPSSISITTVTYGTPRVGNPAFADYVDANTNFTHITNELDPIPILPGEFLGFVQPSGEKHIVSVGDWVACAGQDNDSTDCSTGAVPNILDGDLSDHDGPYDGITMGGC